MNPMMLMAGNYARKNPWQTVIIIVVILGFLLFIYSKTPFYQTQNGLNNWMKSFFNNPLGLDGHKEIDPIETKGYNKTLSQQDAIQYADMLHEAIDGWGTDLLIIEQIFDEITGGDLRLIYNAYGKRKIGLLSQSLDLISNLRSDLNKMNFQSIVLPKAIEAGLL